MDLPLVEMHAQAFKAAEAVGCAGEQGKYWEMRARLFENSKMLEPFSGHAQAIGLDVTRFEACLASGRRATMIHGDMEQAQIAGATGTPWFFVARTDPASTKVTTITVIRGAYPFAVFKAEFDRLLEAGSDR
jgi:protein-disulfide isomerase